MVNRAFAEKYFPGQNVLGKKLKPGAGNGNPEGPAWREIVGVVSDIRLTMTQRGARPAMYAPANQLDTWCCMYSVVRSTVDPASLEQSIRQTVASIDGELPLTKVRTMR